MKPLLAVRLGHGVGSCVRRSEEALGNYASLTLAEWVLQGDEGALDEYREFLRSGGSRFPIESLRRAGVDMEQTTAVQTAPDLFARRVAELGSLLESG